MRGLPPILASKPNRSERTFQEMVLDRHGCGFLGYDRWVLWQCLAPSQRPLCLLIFLFVPNYFHVDLQTIRSTGKVCTHEQFEEALREYRRLVMPRPGRRESRRSFRLSSQRLAELWNSTVAAKESSKSEVLSSSELTVQPS